MLLEASTRGQVRDVEIFEFMAEGGVVLVGVGACVLDLFELLLVLVLGLLFKKGGISEGHGIGG